MRLFSASPINVEKFKYGVSEVWYARTYSEYLSTCAAKQAELMTSLAEAAASEALDTMIDTKIDVVDTRLQEIRERVYDGIVAENEAIDNRVASWDSPEFIKKYDYLYQNDSDFKALVDAFSSDYSYNGLDLTSLPRFFTIHTSDDIIAKDPELNAIISNITRNELDKLGLDPESEYTLDEGFVTFKTLFSTYIFHANLNLTDSELEVDAKDGQEKPIVGFSLNADDIMESIKTNFASATAWAQGFAALCSDNVSDALATFDANIGAIISATNERFAASVATVKAVIASTKANVTAFIDTASEMLGWNKVRDSAFTTVSDTDVAAYTGASPLSAINLKTASGIAKATGKTLLAAGYGMWMGIKAVGKKLWNKVRPTVMALTSNPEDLSVINQTDLSYTISGWCFNNENQVTTLSTSPISSVSTEQVAAKIKQALTGKVGSWVSMDTYFGILMIRINDITIPGGSVVLKYDYQFKPKCMNVKSLLRFGVIRYEKHTDGKRFLRIASGSSFWTSYKAWINTGDIYADDDSSEGEKSLGFYVAVMLLNNLFCAAFADNEHLVNDPKFGWVFSTFSESDGFMESYGDGNATLTSAGNVKSPIFHSLLVDWTGDFPTAVTNQDFLRRASGYLVNQYGNTKFCYVPRNVDGSVDRNAGATVSLAFVPLLAMWIYQQVDKLDNPTDYCFIPYTNGSLDFPEGRYRIKTDAENANIANTIANALITIVVVVAAVLICKSILKFFRTKKMAKLQTKIAIQDNAMWSRGKVLSAKEQHKYIRHKNKLDKLTKASTGLAGGQSSDSTLLSKVSEIGKGVTNNVDVPASVAQGKMVKKQNDSLDNIDGAVLGIERLIKGPNL